MTFSPCRVVSHPLCFLVGALRRRGEREPCVLLFSLSLSLPFSPCGSYSRYTHAQWLPLIGTRSPWLESRRRETPVTFVPAYKCALVRSAWRIGVGRHRRFVWRGTIPLVAALAERRTTTFHEKCSSRFYLEEFSTISIELHLWALGLWQFNATLSECKIFPRNVTNWWEGIILSFFFFLQ